MRSLQLFIRCSFHCAAFTPTRQTKLFNSMYFLLTGFNGSESKLRCSNHFCFVLLVPPPDMMERRHEIEDSIESHGGKVIEKMPPAVKIFY